MSMYDEVEVSALEDIQDSSKLDDKQLLDEELSGSLRNSAKVHRGGKTATMDVAFHGGALYLSEAGAAEPELIVVDASLELIPSGKSLEIKLLDETLKLDFQSEEICHGWSHVLAMFQKPNMLTDEQKALVEEFKAKIPSSVDFEYTERDIIRFLRGNQWKLEDALHFFEEYGFFRRQFQVDKIRISEVLPDIDMEKFSVPGNRDRMGRPVMVMTGSRHIPRDSNFLNTVKTMLYSLERAIEMCEDRDDLCVVVDLKDIGRKNVDERLERMCIEMLATRFPGRFGSFITINTPWWFGALWRLVRPWLNAELRESTHVLRGGADRLKPFFREDQILKEWGGEFEYDKDEWIANRFDIEDIDPGDASLFPVENEYLATLASIPARDAATNAVKTGYMTKLGAVVKNWKKRFFVLTETALFYYADPKSDAPKGSVYLERSRTADVKDETDKKHAFILVTPLRRYVFVCKDDEEAAEWRSVIDETCEALAISRAD